MMKRFKLNPGVTTAQVNAGIKKATEQALSEYYDLVSPRPQHDRRLDRIRGTRRYVHGILTPSLRDTLTATYSPNEPDILEVVFPNNYQGWDRSDFYTRLRVRIYDLIIHHSDLRDKSVPEVKA